jgi:TrmH family RNA methyltransferase
MREVINSSQNKHIKHIRALQLKKNRDNFGQYVIEGYKLIEEALEYNKPFLQLVICESALRSKEAEELVNKAQEAAIDTYIVNDKLFADISELDTPQGAIAVLYKQEHDLEKVLFKDKYNIIILDEVRDPGNVGTIIRTADACGLDAVFLSKGCVDLYNSKTIRATMGSMFHIPVITEVDILKLIDVLKSSSAIVLGADPHSSRSCIAAEVHSKTAIVIGNEAKGMRAEVKEAVTQNISIPMPGKAESLNAGIAAAILMYEFAVRRR